MSAAPPRLRAPFGRFLPLVLLLSVQAAPALSAGEAADTAPPAPARPSFKEAIGTFVRDGRYLLTFPARADRRGVWWTAAFAGATALAMRCDEAIRTNIVDSDRPGASRVATKFEPLGRIQVEAAALASLYLIGRGARSEPVASSSAAAFEAYLWSGLLTSVAKGAFGRERPGRGSGNGEFFAGDTIFPSGHTARSFAIAAVLADRGGRKAAFVAYPVAALVGLSTMQEDLHWGSDVVAGAGLGLAIGKGIASRHPRARAAGPKTTSLALVQCAGGASLRLAF